MAASHSSRTHTARTPLLRRAFSFSAIVFDRGMRAIVWPKLDLTVRLWISQAFFVSGVLKLGNWSVALDLATHEYPVSWLAPATAAGIGVSIEVVGGILLALGLMTRYAALPMLILTLVAQLSYLPVDNQLFWAALLGWYAVRGAGPVSIDALLRRGLADSALPLVPAITRFSSTIRTLLGPLYLSLLRIWVATALIVVSAPIVADYGSLATLLPLRTVASVPPAVALISGALLLVGLATRYASVAVGLALLIGAMIDPWQTDAAYLLMLFAILITFGAGPLSIDRLLATAIATLAEQRRKSAHQLLNELPKVVIVGAGFGGVSCARALRDAPVSVTLVDQVNHHLFQPLLYQVATAALSPGDIAAPIRPLFRESANTRVLLGTVTGVDVANRRVMLGERTIPYDYLVLATGAAHSYFGKDQWAPYAPGLKRIEDATQIRRRILIAFENAEATDDAAAKAALLTFLIVGGGPTGVELAGAIAELARFGMDKEFRTFDPATCRVVLVQSAPRLLPAFAEQLADIARRSLQQLGVEVLLGSRVEHIDGDGVIVSGQRIAAKTVLWAAGVKASPAAIWLGVEPDKSGRVKVAPDLSVPGSENVFVIGDTAASNAWQGREVPGLAPAAKQGGEYVARLITATVRGDSPVVPFVYRHRGSLATIGRKAAIADFGFIKLWGAPAWWLWGLIHVGFLVGVRNRMATMINWFWSYLTFGGGIRLITGVEPSPVTEAKSAPGEKHQTLAIVASPPAAASG